MPKAVAFEKGMSLDDYLAAAGGVSSRADDKNILVAKQNGEVGMAERLGISPGDRILVLPKVDTKGMLLAKDLMQIIYQIAVATKVAVDVCVLENLGSVLQLLLLPIGYGLAAAFLDNNRDGGEYRVECPRFETVGTSDSLAGKVIVVTGTFPSYTRMEVESLIQEAGTSP